MRLKMEGFPLLVRVFNILGVVCFSMKGKVISLPLNSFMRHKKEELTFGQKMADKIAQFGGSWTFIITFFILLMGWIVLNVTFLMNHGFDPYPFILLNLILSCLAAIQAPIIMMSQNRQEEKDRERAEWDLKVNEKAEKEIRELHQKMDVLIEQHRLMFQMMQEEKSNSKNE